MTGDIGAAILVLYGVVTAIGGVAALRQRDRVRLSRTHAGVFALLGVAIAAVTVM